MSKKVNINLILLQLLHLWVKFRRERLIDSTNSILSDILFRMKTWPFTPTYTIWLLKTTVSCYILATSKQVTLFLSYHQVHGMEHAEFALYCLYLCIMVLFTQIDPSVRSRRTTVIPARSYRTPGSDRNAEYWSARTKFPRLF